MRNSCCGEWDTIGTRCADCPGHSRTDVQIDPHSNLVYELNEAQWNDFMYHMTHPKPPTPKMIEAAKRMREWVRRPGDLEYESWGK